MQLKIPSCILKNTTERFYKKQILNVSILWNQSELKKYGFALVLLCLDQVPSRIDWLLWPAKKSFNCSKIKRDHIKCAKMKQGEANQLSEVVH